MARTAQVRVVQPKTTKIARNRRKSGWKIETTIITT